MEVTFSCVEHLSGSTPTNSNTVLSCVVDIVTAVIPQILLWKVQMKKSTKRGLNVIFSLGLITSCLSIARVATISNKVETEDSTCRSYPSTNPLILLSHQHLK